MSSTARAHAFLAKALDPSEPIDLADIESLLKPVPVGEGLHLDYKRGLWLRDLPGPSVPGSPVKAAAKLRKWVSSFANAEGGILMVGVADDQLQDGESEEDAWAVTGCRAPGKNSLSEWASDALRDLGILRLRTRVVPSPGGKHGDEVLLIAVARSDELVWCVEHGTQVHYVRLGSTTIRASEWLLRDLLLGRRRRPRLLPTIRDTERHGSGGLANAQFTYQGVVSIENASPSWAHRLHVSVLGFWREGHPVSDAAFDAMSVESCGLGRVTQSVPTAIVAGTGPWDLAPLSRLDLHLDLRVLGVRDIESDWLVYGAMLLSPQNDIPRWMQLVLRAPRSSGNVRASLHLVANDELPVVFAGTWHEAKKCGMLTRLPGNVSKF